MQGVRIQANIYGFTYFLVLSIVFHTLEALLLDASIYRAVMSSWLNWYFYHDEWFLFAAAAAAAAQSPQSCPTLCDPRDGSPPGSAVPGILQARTLERVAISFSNAWEWKVKVKSLSRARLLATPWTAAYQAPPSMGFSRQEYWSGVPLPSPYAGTQPLKLLIVHRITAYLYPPLLQNCDQSS